MNFQEMILSLLRYWTDYGCVMVQPWDIETGAGTFNPSTFFRVLKGDPWKTVYVEPCRRPTDGRYGENPNRMQGYYQMQVIIKPDPADAQDIYLESLRRLGVDLVAHDVRFVEDDWESPTLGATGLGWEVWLDGMEITQFTYFQQMAGYPLDPVSLEITYGLERIAQFIQKKDSVFDLQWSDDMTYGQVRHREEVEFSRYNFELADTALLFEEFDAHDRECHRLVAEGLTLPAYDHVLKCSHAFNLLDARRAIGVGQRAQYIARVRRAARACAVSYVGESDAND